MRSDNDSRRLWPSVGGLVICLLLSGIVGCGGGGPFDIVPVSGKVTNEDGSTIEADRVRIYFDPQVKPIDKKTHPKRGVTDVDVTDGTFAEVTTHKFGDGLIVGKHTVKVVTYDENGKEIPLEVTPSEVEVTSAGASLDLKVKKK
jgi:predicted small lipoprotein YifL